MESDVKVINPRPSASGEPLWTIRDLSNYYSRSRASIYADIKSGRIDPGFLLTPRCRRWLPAKVKVQA